MVAINNHKLCIHCGGCVGVCPTDAISLEENKIVIDRKKCINCKTCILMCPVKAMSIGE
jgi:ferredoxin